jgi:cytolysin-activating lysine-acyltransferase
MRSKKHSHDPIASLAAWIEPAILLRQIDFFFDLAGRPVGYLTWALLAEDTEQRLLHDVDVVFHISEWNEGTRLWIIDFVLLDGNVREFVRKAYSLFPDAVEAKSLRRRYDGTVRKVTVWRRRWRGKRASG